MFRNLWRLVFPKLCVACERSLSVGDDSDLCASCLSSLVEAEFYETAPNEIEKKFPPETHRYLRGGALYYFHKSTAIQELVHGLKYKGRREIGYWMGGAIAHRLERSSIAAAIDYVIPVPLHPSRERQRGYNQSLFICEGIRRSIGISVEKDNLKRIKKTKAQATSTREERALNMQGAFWLSRPERLNDKSILLIDDVFTTGETIKSCIDAVRLSSNAAIHFAVFAMA